MSKIRRNFTKEQKLEIVSQSLEEGVSIEDLAEQYKIHANSVYKWRREYLRNEGASFPGHGNKVMSAEEQEIARLKKQLKEAELEKEILKKALGIFSSPDRKNLLS
ncbi:MAG: transposase [Saprospiraceae bacterium]|nr:transposase [Saprospiraceae bacterium]MCB9344638.1 transposase [Lewinellaceae bacterium]